MRLNDLFEQEPCNQCRQDGERDEPECRVPASSRLLDLGGSQWISVGSGFTPWDFGGLGRRFAHGAAPAQPLLRSSRWNFGQTDRPNGATSSSTWMPLLAPMTTSARASAASFVRSPTHGDEKTYAPEAHGEAGQRFPAAVPGIEETILRTGNDVRQIIAGQIDERSG